MFQVLANPLFADAGQVFGAIVALFLFARWVFTQIQDAKKQAARQAGQRPPQRPPQAGPALPQAPAAVAGPQGQQADPLRDQVEEFLRRAGRQPQPNQPRAAQRPARSAATERIELLPIDEPSTAERRSLSEPFRPMGQSPAAPRQPAPTKPRRLTSSPRTSVAEHVAEHVSASTQALGQSTSRLGQRIVTDDEQFDVQLKAKFDHTVGTLAASTDSAVGQPGGSALRATPAGQIAALLANPDGVRQAVILSEILRRPSDNW